MSADPWQESTLRDEMRYLIREEIQNHLSVEITSSSHDVWNNELQLTIALKWGDQEFGATTHYVNTRTFS